MNYRKLMGLSVLVSFQLYAMLVVNPLPSPILVASEVQAALHYDDNTSFFKNKMVPDMQRIVINHLDHRSNIQLIAASKHLHKRYVHQAEHGAIYDDCLFTQHPFYYSHAVSFNMYFDCYTRALFHYAANNEPQTKALLLLQDEQIQAQSRKMLEHLTVDSADEGAIMNFYRQQWTDKQYELLVAHPECLQTMLKRGLSRNAQMGESSLIEKIIFEYEENLLKILITDPYIDINERNKNGDRVLDIVVKWRRIGELKILLADSRLNPNLKNKHGHTLLYDIICWSKQEPSKALSVSSDEHKQYKNKMAYSHTNYWDPYSHVFKILLADARIDLNMQDENGCTVIHKAILLSHINALKILLADPRVDLTIKNNEGMTPYMLAASRNERQICRMFSGTSCVYDNCSIV